MNLNLRGGGEMPPPPPSNPLKKPWRVEMKKNKYQKIKNIPPTLPVPFAKKSVKNAQSSLTNNNEHSHSVLIYFWITIIQILLVS